MIIIVAHLKDDESKDQLRNVRTENLGYIIECSGINFENIKLKAICLDLKNTAETLFTDSIWLMKWRGTSSNYDLEFQVANMYKFKNVLKLLIIVIFVVLLGYTMKKPCLYFLISLKKKKG